MKRILFPTDFSDNSRDALNYTLALYRGQALDIKIIHVVDPNGNVSDVPVSAIQKINEMNAAAQRALKKIEERIEKLKSENNNDWKISTSVLVGNPVRQILECAIEFEADLIVLGNKGENHSITDKLLGITAFKLTDEATCPVLLIPKEFNYQGMGNVLFPTNLDYSDPFILWKGIQLLSPHKPVIRCLHVNTKIDTQSLEQDAFAKYMVDNSPSIQTVFHTEEGDDTENNVIEFTETYDCQMIIMHKTKRNFLQKLFSRSLTQNLRRHINVPLLIMNNKK